VNSIAFKGVGLKASLAVNEYNGVQSVQLVVEERD
jgi:hypothetical protein